MSKPEAILLIITINLLAFVLGFALLGGIRR